MELSLFRALVGGVEKGVEAEKEWGQRRTGGGEGKGGERRPAWNVWSGRWEEKEEGERGRKESGREDTRRRGLDGRESKKEDKQSLL